MTPAPISVERLEIDVVGDVCGPRFEMAPHPAGDYVLYSDYAALLQQLAETKGQSDRLCGKYLAALSRAEAAERAREEAFGVLRDIAEYKGDPTTPIHNSVKKSAIARAFLAYIGGKDNG